MATSIQTIGEKHALLNDMDLLVFLGFLVEEMQEHAERYSELASLRAVWQECRTTSGPGTIDLRLEHLEESPLRAGQFGDALSAVEEKVSNFGSCVPNYILNTRYAVPGVRFNDFPALHILALISTLRSLLETTDPPGRL